MLLNSASKKFFCCLLAFAFLAFSAASIGQDKSKSAPGKGETSKAPEQKDGQSTPPQKGSTQTDQSDSKKKSDESNSSQSSPNTSSPNTSKSDASNSDSSDSQENGSNSPETVVSIEVEKVCYPDEWFDNKRWVGNVDDTGSVFDPLDTYFGNVIVTPVQNVLFYDVYYFDNRREKVFKSIADLKKAVGGAQKELKNLRIALGIDPAETKEGEKEEDAEKKELNLVSARNSLKGKIKTAFDNILASKLPDDEIIATFIAIKQEFFELDFVVRNSQDGKLTKAALAKTVTDVSDSVKKLTQFTSLSKRELAWALNSDITVGKKKAYFRGHGVDQVNKMLDSYDEYDNELKALVESEKFVEADGVYSLAQVEQKDGDETKLVDATFTAIGIPFIVLWLVLGAMFFTVRMAFINIRGFTHAIKVTKGDYDDPSDPGEITHFQALSSALSATVGLGNIAGVAIAVSLGGPGAIVWMVIAGFLGMTSKFTECTLGQMYRKVDEDGRVLGGPMRYLSAGLAEMNLGMIGKLLAVMFVILCIGGSLGGGNMFQANQSYAAVKEAVPWFEGKAWVYGLMLAFIVGLVILGGIKRIGTAAGVIVPFMCLIYVLAGLFVIVVNASAIPSAFGTMFAGAFSMKAGFGGLIGTLVVGFQRAAFSNEAGTGSASIAHSAASTDEPVREGIVALLEPFIDTIIVCTMTGLVVTITGAYTNEGLAGVEMTSSAFASVLPWFPYVLSVAVVLFAFSTMISWSYYGERCAIWLFGDTASVPYKFMFLIFVFLGAVLNLGNVLGFSDLMILGMAFPNILGLFLLSGKVKGALNEYWQKLENGEFDKSE